jgi:hypothetical protein
MTVRNSKSLKKRSKIQKKQTKKTDKEAATPGLRRVTRSTSGIKKTVRQSVKNLIEELNREELIALGDQPGWPRRHSSLVPSDMSLDETKAVITAALRSKSLRFAKLRGTMLANNGAANKAMHTEVVLLIARLLPQSNLLCLNIGEWGDATDDAYGKITDSLKHTNIGNLYWNKQAGTSNAPQFIAPATAQLRRNRLKDFYKLESVRDDIRAFSRGGCQSWWNTGTNFFQRVDAELLVTSSTARCNSNCRLMRCHGLNKAGLRCCLCTRHVSRYCHHHRENPYPR